MSEFNDSPTSADATAAANAAANANQSADPNTQNTQQKLVDVALTSQNVSLNVIIGFVTVAQQRGAFSIQESAKIWECIKMFQQPASNTVEQVVEQAVEQAVGQTVNMEVID